MASTNFVPGTVIASTWLNDVNTITYGSAAPAKTLSSIAALRAYTNVTALNVTVTGNANVLVTGYYTPGDKGGGIYYYDSADTTSTDNGGTIIVAANGNRWKLITLDFVSVRQFGAKGDLSQDDAPAIQAAITWAAGGAVYAPVGQYKMNSGVSYTGPINLFGDGTGAGPGPAAQSNANVTQFLAYFSAAPIFSSTTNYPSIFRDFQINVAPANRPCTNGQVGIFISGPTGSNNANSKISNISFVNCYDGVSLLRSQMPVITGCYFDSFINTGVTVKTTAGNEGQAGNIYANYFYGTSGSTTQNACIVAAVGYGHIHHNLLLGANIGVHFIPKLFSAGALRITDNFIENQGQAGVMAESGDGSAASMLTIARNEFSNVAFVANWTASIYITDYSSGTAWLDTVNINNNIHRHLFDVNKRFIWIQSGKSVIVSGEQLYNMGAGSSTYGIDISTFSAAGLAAPVFVRDTQFAGTFGGGKYLLTAVTQLSEQQGLTFAQLPTAANGSKVYVSDGTIANPVAGGGTGCIAKRLNGVWVGN